MNILFVEFYRLIPLAIAWTPEQVVEDFMALMTKEPWLYKLTDFSYAAVPLRLLPFFDIHGDGIAKLNTIFLSHLDQIQRAVAPTWFYAEHPEIENYYEAQK